MERRAVLFWISMDEIASGMHGLVPTWRFTRQDRARHIREQAGAGESMRPSWFREESILCMAAR